MNTGVNGEFIYEEVRMLNVRVLALMNVYILNYKDANVKKIPCFEFSFRSCHMVKRPTLKSGKLKKKKGDRIHHN